MRFCLSLLFFCLIVFNVKSQIKHINNNTNSWLSFSEVNEKYNTSIVGNYDLYISHDNSNTFQQLDKSAIALNAILFNSATIIDENTYVFVGGNDFWSGIVTTVDGGKTLSITHSVTGTSGVILWDVENNGEFVIAVGESGQIVRSNDNGKTWVLSHPVTNHLSTVIYNESTKEWIIGGQDVRLISNDNGLTWTIEKTNGLIRSLQYSNNKIIELRRNDTLSYLNIYESNRQLIKSFSSKNNVYAQSFLLPNGELFSHDEVNFFSNDTVIGNKYFIKDSIYSKSKIQEISYVDVDQTYALIVGSNGAIGKYSFKDPLIKYIPSTFEYTSNINCINDSLQASPTYSYADKYEWFLNGKLISTDKKLLTKPNAGDYVLSLNVYYKNQVSKKSVNISVPKLFFPKFFVYADSILCYNSYFHISIQSDKPLNPGIKYFYNIYDLNTTKLVDSNYFINNKSYPSIGNLLETKMYKIRIYDDCTLKDTIINHKITVDPNLATSYKIKDTIIGFCKGQVPYFKMFNTNKDLIYKINYVEYKILDSITIPLNQSRDDVVFLEIKSKHGCLFKEKKVAKSIFSIPNVNFSYLQNCMEINDTNKIIFTKGDINRWSFSKKPDYFQNDTSNQLGIVYKQKGIYDITLYTETKYNCKDSNQEKIYVSDSKSLFISANECSVTNKERNFYFQDSNYIYLYENSKRILDTEIDSKGNIIQSGYYRYEPGYGIESRSIFFVRKLNQSGKILWEHGSKTFRPNSDNGKYTSIIASRIDDNDNIICILRIGQPWKCGLYYDLINFKYDNEERNYVYFLVKFDSNGKMYFAKRLIFIETITDMVLNNNRLYFLGNSGGTPLFSIFDTLGNKLYKEIDSYNSINDKSRLFVKYDKFIPKVKFTFTTNNDEGNNIDLSLRFKKLCDNSFVCCWYTGKSTICPLVDGKTVNIPANSKFVFIYKYGVGITHCKVLTTNIISTTTLLQSYQPAQSDVVPRIEVDQNQNIYLYESQVIGSDDRYNWYFLGLPYPKSYSIILNDTLLNTPISNHSYVAKFNSNLEKQWVNFGKSQYIKACSVVNDTLYLSGLSSEQPVLINNGNIYSIPGFKNKRTSLYTYLINPLDGRVFNTSSISTNDTTFILNDLYFFNRGSILYRTLNYYNSNKFQDEQLRRISFNNCNNFISTKPIINSCQYFDLSYKDTISYCLTNEKKDFSIDVVDYQNIDTISYKIINNDSVYKEGSVAIINGKIAFETPVFLTSFKLRLTHDNIILDSVIVMNYINNKPIVFSYDSVMCNTSINKVKLISPGTILYDNFSPFKEYEVYIDKNDTSRNKYLPYKYQYPNKCEISDSLKIRIISHVPNKFQFDSIMCRNGRASFYVYPFKSKHYLSYSPELEGRSKEFAIERDSVIFGRYNQGITEFTIKTIDSNNCTFTEKLDFNFLNRQKIIQDVYSIKCNDSVTLNPKLDPTIKYIWKDSNDVIVNKINSNLTSYGLNDFKIEITEKNGCHFTVESKVNNLCKTTEIVDITSDLNNIDAHPNPFKDNLIIDFYNQNLKFISIYSQQGNLIFSKKSDKESEELKLDFLTSGVYFLTIEEEGYSYTQKIVKL